MTSTYKKLLFVTLELRGTACKEYTACDICPYSDYDEKNDVYECTLASSAERLLDVILEDGV